MKSLLLGFASGAALVAATAGPAAAQNWTFDLSAYLWINDTTVTADTPNGEVSQTLSFSDAIESLEFAFMGTVEARNGPWSVIGDLLYFKLAEVAETPNQVLFSEAKVDSKTTVLSSYLTYRAYTTDTMVLDVGVGVRAFWTSIDTTFVGAAAPTESFSQDEDWINPIVAARVRMAFSDQWFGTLMLDAGGLDDSSTWQALATVGYRPNDRWAFQGGYRYLEAESDSHYGETSLEFSGPILGVAYRF
ncbi:MAG: outer membrane beta-barrel protein [Rhodobacteraceae bacterium]|nr:outer membrane beta-barrel protein [Paracoccaceae bacterium]